MSQETNAGLGRDPFATGKDLQRNLVAANFDDLGYRFFAIKVLNHREIAQPNVRGTDLQDVAND
jgi:hypothetical protein